MKKTLGLLFVLLTIQTMTMAQKKDKKAIEITKESETINVPAEKLWAIVGPGFGDAYLWATTVDHSTSSGEPEFEGASCNSRSCDLSAKGFDKIEEKITKYNVNKMSFAYDVTVGMPSFVNSASNDWTVVRVGPNQSKMVLKADFHVKGLMGTLMKGMMEKKMNKLLGVVLNDLKVYAETGQPSESKLARMKELAKKNKAA